MQLSLILISKIKKNINGQILFKINEISNELEIVFKFKNVNSVTQSQHTQVFEEFYKKFQYLTQIQNTLLDEKNQNESCQNTNFQQIRRHSQKCKSLEQPKSYDYINNNSDQQSQKSCQIQKKSSSSNESNKNENISIQSSVINFQFQSASGNSQKEQKPSSKNEDSNSQDDSHDLQIELMNLQQHYISSIDRIMAQLYEEPNYTNNSLSQVDDVKINESSGQDINSNEKLDEINLKNSQAISTTPYISSNKISLPQRNELLQKFKRNIQLQDQINNNDCKQFKQRMMEIYIKIKKNSIIYPFNKISEVLDFFQNSKESLENDSSQEYNKSSKTPQQKAKSFLDIQNESSPKFQKINQLNMALYNLSPQLIPLKLKNNIIHQQDASPLLKYITNFNKVKINDKDKQIIDMKQLKHNLDNLLIFKKLNSKKEPNQFKTNKSQTVLMDEEQSFQNVRQFNSEQNSNQDFSSRDLFSTITSSETNKQPIIKLFDINVLVVTLCQNHDKFISILNSNPDITNSIIKALQIISNKAKNNLVYQLIIIDASIKDQECKEFISFVNCNFKQEYQNHQFIILLRKNNDNFQNYLNIGFSKVLLSNEFQLDQMIKQAALNSQKKFVRSDERRKTYDCDNKLVDKINDSNQTQYQKSYEELEAIIQNEQQKQEQYQNEILQQDLNQIESNNNINNQNNNDQIPNNFMDDQNLLNNEQNPCNLNDDDQNINNLIQGHQNPIKLRNVEQNQKNLSNQYNRFQEINQIKIQEDQAINKKIMKLKRQRSVIIDQKDSSNTDEELEHIFSNISDQKKIKSNQKLLRKGSLKTDNRIYDNINKNNLQITFKQNMKNPLNTSEYSEIVNQNDNYTENNNSTNQLFEHDNQMLQEIKFDLQIMKDMQQQSEQIQTKRQILLSQEKETALQFNKEQKKNNFLNNEFQQLIIQEQDRIQQQKDQNLHIQQNQDIQNDFKQKKILKLQDKIKEVKFQQTLINQDQECCQKQSQIQNMQTQFEEQNDQNMYQTKLKQFNENNYKSEQMLKMEAQIQEQNEKNLKYLQIQQQNDQQIKDKTKNYDQKQSIIKKDAQIKNFSAKLNQFDESINQKNVVSPIIKNSNVSSASSSTSTLDNSAKFKILIVDDNKYIIEALLYKKTNNPMIRHFAKNGKDAMKKIIAQIENKSPYDVIFIDTIMPDQNGMELTKEIREYEKKNKSMLIRHMIIGMKDNEDQIPNTEYQDSGMNHIKQKPFNNLDEIHDQITNYKQSLKHKNY